MHKCHIDFDIARSRKCINFLSDKEIGKFYECFFYEKNFWSHRSICVQRFSRLFLVFPWPMCHVAEERRDRDSRGNNRIHRRVREGRVCRVTNSCHAFVAQVAWAHAAKVSYACETCQGRELARNVACSAGCRNAAHCGPDQLKLVSTEIFSDLSIRVNFCYCSI